MKVSQLPSDVLYLIFDEVIHSGPKELLAPEAQTSIVLGQVCKSFRGALDEYAILSTHIEAEPSAYSTDNMHYLNDMETADNNQTMNNFERRVNLANIHLDRTRDAVITVILKRSHGAVPSSGDTYRFLTESQLWERRKQWKRLELSFCDISHDNSKVDLNLNELFAKEKEFSQLETIVLDIYSDSSKPWLGMAAQLTKAAKAEGSQFKRLSLSLEDSKVTSYRNITKQEPDWAPLTHVSLSGAAFSSWTLLDTTRLLCSASKLQWASFPHRGVLPDDVEAHAFPLLAIESNSLEYLEMEVPVDDPRTIPFFTKLKAPRLEYARLTYTKADAVVLNDLAAANFNAALFASLSHFGVALKVLELDFEGRDLVGHGNMSLVTFNTLLAISSMTPGLIELRITKNKYTPRRRGQLRVSNETMSTITGSQFLEALTPKDGTPVVNWTLLQFLHWDYHCTEELSDTALYEFIRRRALSDQTAALKEVGFRIYNREGTSSSSNGVPTDILSSGTKLDIRYGDKEYGDPEFTTGKVARYDFLDNSLHVPSLL
ncbi:hypothetical protein FA15DRAFT_709246 [Coprinopsis marcescibilis]|uniref:Uncharacterized protein n=1 Tax=Coprinopsis marcescibilis TaxID=230819 RepID=A0A5C3KG75_COPMA|nr:hypothetical protein FA15DRAFT_709246 [Coprinopsis marcescibilis]